MELINKDNKDISDALLEQYKLYVEMMDKVSERRGNANSFFITLHTVVLGIIGINGFNVEKYWFSVGGIRSTKRIGKNGLNFPCKRS